MSTTVPPTHTASGEPCLIVCTNRRLGKPSCRGGELADALEAELQRCGLSITVQRSVCLGACEQGPNVRLAPGGRFFHQMSIAGIGELIAAIRGVDKQSPIESDHGNTPT